jgi:hypothetical protein
VSMLDHTIFDEEIPPFIKANQKTPKAGMPSMLEVINFWVEARATYERAKHNTEPILINESLAPCEHPFDADGKHDKGYMYTVTFAPDVAADEKHFWGIISAFIEVDDEGKLLALHVRQDNRGKRHDDPAS